MRHGRPELNLLGRPIGGLTAVTYPVREIGGDGLRQGDQLHALVVADGRDLTVLQAIDGALGDAGLGRDTHLGPTGSDQVTDGFLWAHGLGLLC